MLIHKRIKELARFTCTDTYQEPLNRIYVDKSEAVATDDHVIVRMPIKEQDNEAYPATTNTTEITAPVLLDTEAVNRAISMLPKKPTLPVLNSIQVGIADGKTVINAGLPPVQFPVQCAEGSLVYPDYKQVIPDYSNRRPLKLVVNAEYLKRICDLAVKYGPPDTKRIVFEVPTVDTTPKIDAKGETQLDGSGGPVMEFAPISTLSEVLKFEISYDGQTMFCGVLMPLKADI